jgi:hypothetical protein
MKFEISPSDLEIIRVGLGEVQLKHSGPVLARLMQQMQKPASETELTQDVPQSHADKQY